MKLSVISTIIQGNIRWKALLVGLALYLVLGVSTASADDPALVNLGVSIRGNLVTMHARLVDGFTDSITEAIESGVPMTFTYHLELRRDITMWNDSLVSSNTVHHTVQYDSLKKVYRFTAEGKGINRKINTRKRANYQKLMLTLEDIPIASIRRMDPDEKYYIRVKADLETDRFWFPFNYLFFFVPFNDFKTSWTESSILSIDPDLELAEDAFRRNSHPDESRKPKVLNHVVRSFNQ